MIKRVDNIGIAASDVEKTVAFFRDILGLEAEAGDWGGSVRIGDASLYVFQANGSAPRGAARTVDLPSNPVGIDHVAMEVDDIEVAGRTLEAKGIAFPGPIVGEPGEFRYRGFAGPDGIMLYIIQRPAGEA